MTNQDLTQADTVRLAIEREIFGTVDFDLWYIK